MTNNHSEVFKDIRRCSAALPWMRNATASAQAQQKRRNIIFILIDDMRFDSMALWGIPS